MISLAKNLGTLLTQVGGASKVKYLLKPLEQLCNVEEGMVRQEAVNSISKILEDVNVKDFESDLVGIVRRLSEGEWHTSHSSAALLLPSICPHISEEA
jgi:serine/threonine-protein phosphatase 2A regulatory subunit A